MSKFQMEFKLDNAAYRNEDESVNLEAVQATVRQQVGMIEGITFGSEIRDINGNLIGAWEIFDDASVMD